MVCTDKEQSASDLGERSDTYSWPQRPAILPDEIFNRSYKSRKERPCDLCRKRKQTCRITAGLPCLLCKKQKVDCTFLVQPTKRRRRNLDETPRSNEYSLTPQQPTEPLSSLPNNIAPEDGDKQEPDATLLSTEVGSNSYSHVKANNTHIPPEIGHSGTADTYENVVRHDMNYYDPLADFNPLEDLDFLTEQLRTPSSEESDSPNILKLGPASVASIDAKQSHSVQAVGLSADFDPFVMSRYKYNDKGEYTFKMISFRQLSGSPDSTPRTTPVQMMMSDNRISSLARSQMLPKSTLPEVDQIIDPDIGIRLMKLFFTFVYPTYPVLSRSRFQKLGIEDYPKPLLAAIYALALPFSSYDELLCTNVYDSLSEDPLYAIAYKGLCEELHTPSTSTLQTCLLLLQGAPAHPYVADSPFKWTLAVTALSIAQTLGLHYDCSKWVIPVWEIRLRRRLWWITYVTEIWIALTMGRPSNIDDDNFTTSPLHDGDFFLDDGIDNLDSPTDGKYLIYFVRLTFLMKDILKRLYSLKASAELGSDLTVIIEAVKPLQIRLKEFQTDLPHPLVFRVGEFRDYKNSSASFQLHILAAEVMLHRTFFRALVSAEDVVKYGDAAVFCRHAAKACFKRITAYVASLTVPDAESFWYSWSRIFFSTISHFGLSIWACSPDLKEARNCMQLIQSWRWTLRLQSKLSRHLMKLGLLRLDAIVGAQRPNMLKLDSHVESTRLVD